MLESWENYRSDIIDTSNRTDYMQFAFKDGYMKRVSIDEIPDKYWYIRKEVENGITEPSRMSFV